MSLPVRMAIIHHQCPPLLVAQFLVPLVGLCADVGSWRNLAGATRDARDDLTTSVWIALLAGAVCAPLALGVAERLARSSKDRWAWWLLVLAPLAIPAPLVGIGLISLWNTPSLGAGYETLAMPVLAVLARIMPEMNILFISLPLRVGMGMLMMAIFMPFIYSFMSEFTDRVGKLLPV